MQASEHLDCRNVILGFGKSRTKEDSLFCLWCWKNDLYSVWKPHPLSVPIYHLSPHLTSCRGTPGNILYENSRQAWDHRSQQWGLDISTTQSHISLRIDCGKLSQNVFHFACLTLNIVKRLKTNFGVQFTSIHVRRKWLKKHPPKHLQLI